MGLAFVIPDAGANGGWLRTETTTRLAVALIFLLQGLGLPLHALRSGAARWPLHLLVQSTTFLLFPLLGIALDAFAGRFLPPDLRLGFLLMCVLPSTISSSVVLTSLAGGNTAGAIFNAALSNLLGVFLTPLWVAWLTRATGARPDLGQVVRDIGLLLLAPMAAGQLLRLALADWADARKRLFSNAASGLVLFLVFAAFCNSVKARLWDGLGDGRLAMAFAGVAGVFTVATLGVEGLSRWMRLDRADRIAASFCAPQKTIASGIPLAKAMFGAHPGLGLILLPVMLYHTLQLVVSGVLADRWRRQASRGRDGGEPQGRGESSG